MVNLQLTQCLLNHLPAKTNTELKPVVIPARASCQSLTTERHRVQHRATHLTTREAPGSIGAALRLALADRICKSFMYKHVHFSSKIRLAIQSMHLQDIGNCYHLKP